MAKKVKAPTLAQLLRLANRAIYGRSEVVAWTHAELAPDFTYSATDGDIRVSVRLDSNLARPPAASVALNPKVFLATIGRAADFDSDMIQAARHPTAGPDAFDGVRLSGPDESSPFYGRAVYDAATLAESLAYVAPAISTEETRYYLNGVYFAPLTPDGSATRGAVRFVATDGHRLHSDSPMPLDCDNGAAGIIAPRPFVDMLARACALYPAERVNLAWCAPDDSAAARVAATIGRITITSKVIDGTFPDYLRVIPAADAPPVAKNGVVHHASVDPSDYPALESDAKIAAAIRAAGGGSGYGKGAILVLSPAGASVPAYRRDYPDSAFISFNARYFFDATNGATAHLRVIDSGSPTRITFPDRPDRLSVLMPMRGDAPAFPEHPEDAAARIAEEEREAAAIAAAKAAEKAAKLAALGAKAGAAAPPASPSSRIVIAGDVPAAFKAALASRIGAELARPAAPTIGRGIVMSPASESDVPPPPSVDVPMGSGGPLGPVYAAAFRDSLRADESFSAECHRQFGRDAGDNRYFPESHDAATRAAGERFVIASGFQGDVAELIRAVDARQRAGRGDSAMAAALARALAHIAPMVDARNTSMLPDGPTSPRLDCAGRDVAYLESLAILESGRPDAAPFRASNRAARGLPESDAAALAAFSESRWRERAAWRATMDRAAIVATLRPVDVDSALPPAYAKARADGATPDQARAMMRGAERLRDVPRDAWSDSWEYFATPDPRYVARVKLAPDESSDPPWENCSPLAEVRERSRYAGDNPDSGWRRIGPDGRHEYHFAAAVAEALSWDKRRLRGRADARATAERIAAEECRRFDDWLRDGWSYVGVRVEIIAAEDRGDDDAPAVAESSVWRVESDGGYWREIAAELVAECVATAEDARLDTLAACHPLAFAAADHYAVAAE